MLPKKVKCIEISESQPVLNLENNIRPEKSFHTSSICSGSQCDSVDCFEIRDHNSQLLCKCADCKNTKTCALSHKSLLKETDDKRFKEIIRNNTREYQNNNSINIRTKSGKSEVELSENTKYSYKDTTLITNKTEKRETSSEKSYTRNYRVAVSYGQDGEKAKNQNSTATLSAEVMNLPFQEFKDSLSLHKSFSSFNSNKLVKPDILTKLKEIYKTCSCKVCECITGKLCYPNNDNSNNETCDCGYTNDHITQFGFKQVPHSGCPCVSCDRKDCRGIVKKNITDIATCDCRPCDCVKFESFTKPCDCEPCQCTECNHSNYRVSQSVIVASVQGNFEQNLCQCAPCECVQCTHRYSAMASSLIREISTSMVSQRNCDCETCLNHSCQLDSADCRCETQNKIMRKPIERNNRDYDLRRALIGHDSFSYGQYTTTKNYDTIAMYALSSNFSNSAFNTAKKERCKCTECECIVCKDINKHGTRIIYNYIHKSPDLFNQSFSVCKCQPCECQVCSRDEMGQNNTLNDSANKCGCDICDCIVCKGLPYCSENNGLVGFSTTGLKYKSSVHLFKDCDGLNKTISRETFFPLKKGKLLTPSVLEAKILSCSQIKSRSQSCLSVSKKPCKSILKVNGKKSSGKILAPVNISISHKKSSNKYGDSGNNQASCQNISARLSNLQNDSQIKIVPTNCESSTAYIHDLKNNLSNSKILPNNLSNTACNVLDTIVLSPTTNIPSNKIHKMDTENGVTNIIYSHESLPTCVDKITKDKLIYNQNHIGEQYKSTRRLKKRLNDDKDLFNAKIISFEKSISQLIEDVSRHLKTLSEIRSKDKILNDDIVDIINIFDNTISDNLLTKKSFTSIHNINRIDTAEPIKFVEFCEEPEKMESLVDTEKQCDSENLSNGDKTMYTKLIKRTQVNKRKNELRLSKAKIIKQRENKIKNNINGHSKNKLNLTLNTKSTCMAPEDCSDNRLPNINETVIDQGDDNNHWSILKKGLYLNNILVRKNKGVCTIPELEIEIKRTVQSLSSQTPEFRGYNALTKLELEANDLLNSPMLQSCYKYPKYHVMDNQNIDSKPKSKLDLELKCLSSNATSQTPRQSLTVEKEVLCKIGQSMEALKCDISLLLDAILTRAVYKSESTRPYSTNRDDGISKIESVKSSCDVLKASFMGLRKVSDHTVLLKWKKPPEVADVQGYELQVDGRAVQKILNPTRCMAVLTCLPHCDKLLLTIRTLTTSVATSGHHPATTIVYCPREKHSRYSNGSVSPSYKTELRRC